MKFTVYEIKRDPAAVLQAPARLDVACKYESNEFSRGNSFFFFFCGQIVARRDEWRERLAERLRIKSDFKYTALKARSRR